MQAVIFGTSGTNSLQSRKTSGVQACCASALTAADAGAEPTVQARTKIAALAASQNVETFLCPTFVIGEPLLSVFGIVAMDALPSRSLMSRRRFLSENRQA
jgi:hypothetical protein